MLLRRSLFLFFVLAVFTAVLAARSGQPWQPVSERASGSTAARAVPLMFEPGSDGRGYVAQSRGYAIHLTHDGADLHGGGTTIGLRFVRGGGTLRAERPLPTVINHFHGRRDAGRSGIRAYGAVRLAAVYPGIDAVFYGSDRHVEYDLVLTPGANPDAIRLQFDGASAVELREGHLQLHAGNATFTQQAPVA